MRCFKKGGDAELPAGKILTRSTCYAENARRDHYSETRLPQVRNPASSANLDSGVRDWKNSIRTATYHWWSFPFLNLIHQCMIATNAYFIMMGFLQLIPAVSDSGGVPTTLVPVGFVMAVSMLKDGYEDVKRHRSDRQENNSSTLVISPEGEITTVRWSDLKPGDIVKVMLDEPFPADLILLSSSDPFGLAYVETVSLDGETNLKIKTCIPEFSELVPEENQLHKACVELVMPYPSAQIHCFQGVLQVLPPGYRPPLEAPSDAEELMEAAKKGGAKCFFISVGQFLWRGASLRTTDYVYGMVAYAGHKTRIFMNTRGRQPKSSSLMKKYNSHILWTGVAQIMFCLAAAIISASEVPRTLKYWYLMPEGDELLHAQTSGLELTVGILSSIGIGFGRFMLLLSQFVPITLLVQVEFAHWVQAFFLNSDESTRTYIPVIDRSLPVFGDSADPTSVTATPDPIVVPATCHTVSIMEELGCITHVFSDKTGTLTQNLMQFRSVTVGPHYFGQSTQHKELENSRKSQIVSMDSFQEARKVTASDRNSPYPTVAFDADAFRRHMELQPEQSMFREFLLCLSLCHSVVVSKKAPPIKRLGPARSVYDADEHTGLLQVPHNLMEVCMEADASDRHSRTSLRSSVRSSHRILLETPASHIHVIESEPSFAGFSVRTQESESSSLLTDADISLAVDEMEAMRQSLWESNPQHSASLDSEPADPQSLADFIDSLLPPRPSPATVAGSLATFFCEDPLHWASPKATLESHLSLVPEPEGAQGGLPPQAPVQTTRASAAQLQKVDYPLYNRLRCDLDASSPDELALVSGAKHIGIELVCRPSLNSVQVCLSEPSLHCMFLSTSEQEEFRPDRSVDGAKDTCVGNASAFVAENFPQGRAILPALTFDVLDVLDFDNVRKRMSVIIRDRDGTIKILSKGADSGMLVIAKSGQDGMVRTVVDHLEYMSIMGLRTLVFGSRTLTESEFQCYADAVGRARMATDDDAEDRLIEVYELVESDLTILGSTGIDDKLQDEVADTVQAIKDAGIQLWVLTGDKLETAISIGHSCNILSSSTYNAVVDGQTAFDVKKQMHNYMLFVVAAQLCQSAFDTLERPKERDGDEPELTVLCNCWGRRHQTGPAGSKDMNRVQMGFNEFARLLKVQATSSKSPNRCASSMLEHVQITSDEADALISAYLESFVAAQDAGAKKTPSKSGVSQDVTSQPSGRKDPSLLLQQDTLEGQVARYNSVSLTITGHSLELAMASEEGQRYLFGLGNLCSSVIACRVTPKQKAEVIQTCKKFAPYRNRNTCFRSLAVGDGANDVNMILTADVGVGIQGKEGMQAVRSADISIGEFRFLKNILFCHGHECLRRNSVMVYNTLWKNIYFGAADFFFGFYNLFSAVDIYNTYLKQIFNLVFTPGPIMFFAWFDRMLPYEIFLNTPSLYPVSVRPDGSMYFGTQYFIYWLLYALAASAVTVVFPLFAFGDMALSSNGKVLVSFDDFGTAIFSIVVVVGLFSVVPFIQSWYTITVGIYVFEFVCWYSIWVLMSYLLPAVDTYGSFESLNRSPAFHMIVLISCIISLLPLFLANSWDTIFHPTMPVIIRERIKAGVHDVVVQSNNTGAVSVVVPLKNTNAQWKGFAFSEEQFANRLSVQRLVRRRVEASKEVPAASQS